MVGKRVSLHEREREREREREVRELYVLLGFVGCLREISSSVRREEKKEVEREVRVSNVVFMS